MCGDSTSEEDFEKLMNGNHAQMAVTFPPYGVGKEYEKPSKETLIMKALSVDCELSVSTFAVVKTIELSRIDYENFIADSVRRPPVYRGKQGALPYW